MRLREAVGSDRDFPAGLAERSNSNGVFYNVIHVSENVITLTFYSGCAPIIIKLLWGPCRH